MHIKFLLLGSIFLVSGVFAMTKSKFYQQKPDDMLFAAGFKAFLGAALIALVGVMILFNEIKKMI